MAGLVIKDTIEVETSNGVHEIQLCFGSVTKITAANAVDVLVLSAFPGDYSTTPTSVIGALWRELKVNVRDLAQNKEEDLRSLFSCWWSKQLPSKLNFKRLLCFEGGFKHGMRPPMVVSEVFRCLISMCKEQDITTMMPLLGAGDQGYSKQLMLRLMVQAAIHWMQAGFPLKTLKIVVFTRNPEAVDIATDPLLLYFQELKSKWLEERMKQKDTPAPVIKYDIYLSFSPSDEETAINVKKKLMQKKENIRIFAVKQEVNSDESFQEEIYEVMVSCARVITLLSPSYLNNSSCVEQYNIALCCTRNIRRDYLAPFYINTIQQMPTYMCLVQYIDCRPPECPQIIAACEVVVKWLQSNVDPVNEAITDESDSTKKHTDKKTPSANLPSSTYDVFISYSHATTKASTHILQMLRRSCPDWNIFFDTDMLTVGDSWQIKLFESIESSKVVIALLSVPYLQSVVCQEEFNLAYGLHRDSSYKTNLVAVQIEECPSLPQWCAGVQAVQCLDVLQRSNINAIVASIKSMLDSSKPIAEEGISLRNLYSDWRSMHCFAAYPFFRSIDPRQPKESNVVANVDTDNFDVVLCYNDVDNRQGEFLCARLKSILPNVQISVPDGDNVRFDVIDRAKLVIPLISTEFIRSAHNMAEFSTALARHRHSPRLVLFPVLIDAIPSSPAYIHMVWCLFSTLDACWRGKNAYERDTGPDERCLRACAHAICTCLVQEGALTGTHRTLLPPHELLSSRTHFNSKATESLSYNPLVYVSYNPLGEATSRLSINETKPQDEVSQSDGVRQTEKKKSKKRLSGKQQSVRGAPRRSTCCNLT